MKTYKDIKLASGVHIDELMVNDRGEGRVRCRRKHDRDLAIKAEKYLRDEGFLTE